MARRFKPKPPIKMSFWKQDGKLWCADPSDLKAAISTSGIEDKLIQERMGAGYHYIQDIFDGKRLDGWAISHIEWGLIPKTEPNFVIHSWPSRN